MSPRLKVALNITNLGSTAAALLLIASPWLAGFTGDAITAGNAVLCGVLILFFTAASILQLRDWRSWMNLVPGVWLLLSPWILAFTTHLAAAAAHFLIGLIVSILAMVDLFTTETPSFED